MIHSLKNLRTKMPARIPTWGFTLIELAIVLGVAGLLFAGLWRLMSGGNQQLRDQAAASSQTQLISAVKGYLASSEGQSWMASKVANAKIPLTLPSVAPDGTMTGSVSNNACKTSDGGAGTGPSGICDFLPIGFSSATTNSYGQAYTVQVLKDSSPQGTAPTTYSFMVVTSTASGGTAIPDSSGGRISSSIGGDGGFVYSNNVCDTQAGVNAPNLAACGAYGAWAVALGTAYGAPTVSGTIASRTFVSPEQDSNLPWLARGPLNNDATYNTMITDLKIGPASSTWQGHAIGDISQIKFSAPSGGAAGEIIMNGGGISIAAGALPTANAITNVTGGITNVTGGITNVTGGITMGGGSITGVGNGTTGISMTTGAPIAMNGGSITLGGGSIIGTPVTAGAVISLSNTGTAAPGINITTSCTADPNIAGYNSNCTSGAISIPTGDINVGNGFVNAHDLYAGGFIYGQLATPSDMRLKTKIEPLQHSLDDIEKLKPVSYDLKSTGKPNLGLLAQDLEKVYPDLVTNSPDGYKAVSYQELIAPLIGAVQELKSENDQLRQQLDQQGARQEKLEKLIKVNASH